MNKGHGVIKMQSSLWSDIGSPVTSAEWAKAILLPDGYEVERTDRDGQSPETWFNLFVASESIPISDAEIIVQVYHRIDYGVVSLDHISFAQWNGEHWQEVQR